MKRICGVFSALLVTVCLGNRGIGQQGSDSATSAPLTLTGAIPLPNVQGRIDHFGFDPKSRFAFLSALGNNSEEVINLSAQRVVRSITGVPTPQGVAYSAGTNKLFVGSDEGKLYIYDGTAFDLIARIDFGDRRG